MTSTGYPRVLAILPGLYPSTIINVVKPLVGLHQAGKIELDLSFEYLVRPTGLAQVDVVVFCRNLEPQYNHILTAALKAGKPIIYDLDDNLLEVPDTTPAFRYLRAPARQAQLKNYLTQAHLIRVYAPALQRYLADYNANVVKINGPLDWSLLPEPLPARNGNRIKLIYATARLEDEIGGMLVKTVLHVLDTFPQVELTIWGPQLKQLYRHPRIRHLKMIMDYDRYFYKFARQGFDIGLAPLPDDLFHRCKTNVKFREYAACSIAGVYANTEVYRDCVEEGVTGLLVDPVENAWFEAIVRLIEDTTLRETIQQQAQSYARCHYNQEIMQAGWLAHIQQVLEKKQPATRQHVQAAGSFAAASGPSYLHPLILGAGMVKQMFRYSRRIIPLLKSSGWHVTLSRIRLHIHSFKQLIALKLMLRQLRRRSK